MKTLSEKLIKLISFKTISGKKSKAEVERLYKWFSNFADKKYYKSKILTINGFPSLILTPRKYKTNLILSAHIDVVSGNSNQFKGITKNNKLYGRGASDMKFAVAVYAKLLEELPENLAKKGVKIILTSDEEIGGENGVKWLIEKGEFASKVVILPDASNNFALIKEAKGVLWLKITQKGKSAHASRPWEGVNPYNTLLKDFLIWQKTLPDSNKNRWVTTASISKVEGGNSINQIPQEASIYADIRFTNKSSALKILNEVKEYLPNATVEVLMSADNVSLDTKNQYVKKFENITIKVTSRKIKYDYDPGTSDARFIQPLKIPVIMTKPLSGGHHSQNEWIDLESLEVFYEVLKKFIQLL